MSSGTTYTGDEKVTINMLEDFGVMLYNASKVYMTNHIDELEIMQSIKATLGQCLRMQNPPESTATRAQLILTCINAIATVLQNKGISTENLPFTQYAHTIEELVRSYWIGILCKDGNRYTIAEWQQYIEEHSTTPGPAVCAVETPYQSFVIGLTFPGRAWGNTTDYILLQYGQQTGSFINVLQNNLIFQGLINTRQMLLWYNPDILPHTQFDPSDPTKDYSSYGCVHFATNAEMQSSGVHVLNTDQVYVVDTDEVQGVSNAEYYWNGTSYVYRFTVPRVANNITGSPAAEFAWQYKAWEGDTRQWFMPTINHLLMMYVYYTQINAVLSILNLSTLPTGSSWSCQQSSASNAYTVTIPSGSVNFSYSNKSGSTYVVVPVAAL